MSDYLHIRDIHKDFSGLKVLEGVDPQGQGAGAPCHHRPERRRQDHALQHHEREFQAAPGPILLRGQDISGRPAYELNRHGLSRSFQITNVFPELSPFSKTSAPGSGPGTA